MPLILILFFIMLSQNAFGQDKIYTANGEVLKGKVVEINSHRVTFYLNTSTDTSSYFIVTRLIDSIVFSNGAKDEMENVTSRRKLKQNVPRLNTWCYDIAGLTYLSLAQSYERRLKNGKLGFKVPLYVGYEGGGIAGTGLFFTDRAGVFVNGQQKNHLQNLSSNGFSIASGLNLKCYLFKHSIVRAFVGPETTIGYSVLRNTTFDGQGYQVAPTEADRYFTFTALGKAGLTFTPVGRFTFTIDAGAGAGCMEGKLNNIGWLGTWQVGFAMGTLF